MWNADGKTIAQPDRVIRGLHFRCAGDIVGDASQKNLNCVRNLTNIETALGEASYAYGGEGVT